MQTLIKSVHFTARPELEEYTRDKIDGLSKLNSKIIRAHVTLSVEPGSSPENKSCEPLIVITWRRSLSKENGSNI